MINAIRKTVAVLAVPFTLAAGIVGHVAVTNNHSAPVRFDADGKRVTSLFSPNHSIEVDRQGNVSHVRAGHLDQVYRAADGKIHHHVAAVSGVLGVFQATRSIDQMSDVDAAEARARLDRACDAVGRHGLSEYGRKLGCAQMAMTLEDM